MSATQVQRLLARSIGKRWKDLSPNVRTVLSENTVDFLTSDPDKIALLKSYELTAKQVADFMTAYAKGMQYVFERFGTEGNVPEITNVTVIKQDNRHVVTDKFKCAYYAAKDATVVHPDFIKSRTPVPGDDAARIQYLSDFNTTTGVEESFHRHQFATNRSEIRAPGRDPLALFKRRGDLAQSQDAAERFAADLISKSHDPLELVADAVVEEAIRDMSLGPSAFRKQKTRR